MQVYTLDFDMECKPGHWIGGDYVSKIVTAVAWGWLDGDQVTVLTHYDATPQEMAKELAAQIALADVVTGHYIRGFDLPLLNGELLRHGLAPLGTVMASDTKQDLYSAHGRSKSQENLASMVGVQSPKIQLSNWDWEQFNSLNPEFKSRGVERVVGDVIQHKELRRKLIELEWLGGPRAWTPGVSSGGYRP